jgi:uncharacterized protein YdhG (YjbR/CyaY superfamily)
VTESVDSYIASFPDESRAGLEAVRLALRSVLPQAEESISYAIPALKLDGRPVIYFAGAKKHIGVYPAPTGDAAFEDAIAPYRSGRATLRFMLSKPLPLDLISRIGAAALRNHIEREQQRRAGRRSRG